MTAEFWDRIDRVAMNPKVVRGLLINFAATGALCIGLAIILLCRHTAGYASVVMVCCGIFALTVGTMMHSSYEIRRNWDAEYDKRILAEEVISDLKQKIEDLGEGARSSDSAECSECDDRYQLGIRDALLAVGEVETALDEMPSARPPRRLTLVTDDIGTAR